MISMVRGRDRHLLLLQFNDLLNGGETIVLDGIARDKVVEAIKRMMAVKKIRQDRQSDGGCEDARRTTAGLLGMDGVRSRVATKHELRMGLQSGFQESITVFRTLGDGFAEQVRTQKTTGDII
jgi:hypothetical protein